MTRKIAWLAGVVLLAVGGRVGAGDEGGWLAQVFRSSDSAPSLPANPVPVRFSGTASPTKGGEKERCIQQKLSQRVSLSFKDTPLKVVIDYLRDIGGINVVEDTAAFEEANISLNLPLSLKVEDMSLKSALNILLKKVRLTYIVKDEALQITTPERGGGKPRTETYAVADLVLPVGSGESELPPFICLWRQDGVKPRHPGQTGEDALRHLIMNSIEPESWAEMGGRGTIEYVPAGQNLVVQQRLDVQEQITELLAAVRRLQQEEYKKYQLDVKLVEVPPNGFETALAWPPVTIVRGQKISVLQGTRVPVSEGTIKDLLPAAAFPPFEYQHGDPRYIGSGYPGSCRVQRPGCAPKDAVDVGMTLHAALVALPPTKQLRLDLTIVENDIVESTEEGIQLTGHTYRFLQKVECGKAVKRILEKNEKGEPKKWVECTVTELEMPVQEPPCPSSLPSIPR